MYQPSRASSSLRSCRVGDAGEPRACDPHQVVAEVHQHRRHRAELRDGGERRAGILPAEERGHDPQVRGARDRQELRQALHDAEHDGFQPLIDQRTRHASTHRRSGKDALASGRHRQRACDRPVGAGQPRKFGRLSSAETSCTGSPRTTALSASLRASAGGRCEGGSPSTGALRGPATTGRSTPRQAFPRRVRRWRSSRKGSKAKPPPSRRRAPRLSCTWKRATVSSTGSIRAFDGRALEVGDDVRVSDVEQHADRGESIRARACAPPRVVADAGRPGIDRAQVLEAYRHVEGLGPARDSLQRLLLGRRLGPCLAGPARDRRCGKRRSGRRTRSAPRRRGCAARSPAAGSSGRARRCSAPSPPASGEAPGRAGRRA